MTKSNVVALTVNPVVEEKSITIDHFEDAGGNAITSITEGKTFNVIGYFKQNSTPLPNERVWVYRTNSEGVPNTPYERNSSNTDSSGKYAIGFTAMDVTESTLVHFRAYDDAQKPS